MKTVKELRMQLNMSLNEFSCCFEIPYNTLRQWENGEREPPIYIIKLLNELIALNVNGKQLQNCKKQVVYFCYSIDKTGKTGVYRGSYLDDVEKWKNAVKKKKEDAWIDTHVIINSEQIN